MSLRLFLVTPGERVDVAPPLQPTVVPRPRRPIVEWQPPRPPLARLARLAARFLRNLRP